MMNYKEIQLKNYEEIVGKFVELKEKNEGIQVILSSNGKIKKLKYPLDSKQGNILLKKFQEIDTGTEIGILRTDIRRKPLILREIEKK